MRTCYTWKKTCLVQTDPCTQTIVGGECKTQVWFWVLAGALSIAALVRK